GSCIPEPQAAGPPTGRPAQTTPSAYRLEGTSMSEPTTSPTTNPDQTEELNPTNDFDPTNRAWQRLHLAVEEHLDVITWRRDDGRPVLLSLVDLRSGDVVTLAVIDSLQLRDPHAL